MGLFDDDELDELLEEAEEETKKYPSYIANLDEGTVQALYNRCLATEEEKKDNALCRFVRLFYKDYTGIESGDICFSRDKINKNRKNIEYLFGQLKAVHTPKEGRILTLQDSAIKYDNTAWTKDLEYLFNFLNLASATGHFKDFTRKENTIYTDIATDILPTFSPKGPNFPAWWEEHKGEWEQEE